ncbi:archaeosortase/exosortase family protein [Hyunsoonleella sp. SJ7]|uniref:Archaeosortase/exosortase family protein n=1 Tax=Hyunsoonleella aquatilis TaxID=2762758 RepID=A0A923KLV8_9FLAO|nr:archaeosortase/exosortase family protein [Hyunsoonleella aquatilis]MBC3758360.1 archaeosortase/exosortase family protein [Hyunsoonleella aquatilis]
MIDFRKLKNDIPLPIRLFLGKALLFFIVWKVIYSFFLYDSKVLDHPLTAHVGKASAKFLNNFTSMSGFVAINELSTKILDGEYVTYQASSIYHYEKRVLNIADACNGLELMVLYIGFIICMPSGIWRKIRYIIIGLILIDIINILRCAGLIYLGEYYDAYFDFAHHYLFKITVYATTFVMWIVFARKIRIKNEPVPVR